MLIDVYNFSICFPCSDGECVWEPTKTIEVPPSADFRDYAGMVRRLLAALCLLCLLHARCQCGELHMVRQPVAWPCRPLLHAPSPLPYRTACFLLLPASRAIATLLPPLD